MYQMLFYGFMLGIVTTIGVQEIHAALERYKDRKQAEFEAAVAAEAAHRRAQAERDWSSIQTGIGDTARHSEMQNVRTFKFDDDPFADV